MRPGRLPIHAWKRHPRDWAEKNRAAQTDPVRVELRKRDGTCIGCGAAIRTRAGLGRWCSKKCSYEHAKRNPDHFAAKAVTLASSIRLGAGKREKIAGLLRKHVDKPCAYCGDIVTLSNCQIDHIVPVTGIRGTPIALPLDSIDNLQVICRGCNIAKGSMDDAAFRLFLGFLRSHPMIYKAVWHRIRSTGHGWAAIKRGGWKKKS